MKAVVLERRGAGGVEWRDFPDPTPAAGELVMRVIGSSAQSRRSLYARQRRRHHARVAAGHGRRGRRPDRRSGAGQRLAARDESRTLFRGVLRQVPRLPCRRSAAVRVAPNHGRAPPRCFRGIRGDALELFFPASGRRRSTRAGMSEALISTAWRTLFSKKTLRPGESVLVVGIGGGVAVACLQLARMIGARVFVTSSSD